MIDYSNPVVFRWLAEFTPTPDEIETSVEEPTVRMLGGGEASSTADIAEECPEIKQVHVEELNEVLRAGKSVPGHLVFIAGDATQHLAAFNLSIAAGLELPDITIKKCARTLLELAVQQDLPPLDTLDQIGYALELFEARELGILGYTVRMQYAAWVSILESTYTGKGDSYLRAAKQYRQAAGCAEQLDELCKDKRTVLQAHALASAGRASFEAGDQATGRREIEAALAMVPAQEVAQNANTARARASVLQTLAEVVAEAEDANAALGYQQEAIAIIGGLAEAGSEYDETFTLALWRLGNLQAEAGGYSEARLSLERALPQYQALAEMDEDRYLRDVISITNDLVEVLKAGGWEQDAQEVLSGMLTEHGAFAAALAGDGQARKVVNLWERSEDEATGWYREEYRVSARVSAGECALLAILNADRELVEKHLAECEAASTETGKDTTECRLPGTLVLGSETRKAEFYQSVLFLQRMAELICEGRYSESSSGDLRFHDFALRDIDVLNRVVSRGESHPLYYIDAAPFGGGEGTYNYNMPEEDFYCPLPPNERVDLLVCRLELLREGTSPPDRRIWEAFRQLMDMARTDRQHLRRCSVPRSPTRRLDFLLGEAAEDSPVCGCFYIAQRGGRTCGSYRCKKNFTHPEELPFELQKRVPCIAKWEWRKADTRVSFDKLWGKVEAHDDPKEMLFHFRKALGESLRKRGRKK